MWIWILLFCYLWLGTLTDVFLLFFASLKFALQCPSVNCNLAFIIHSKHFHFWNNSLSNITLLILLHDYRLLNSNGSSSNECLFLLDLESGCGSLIPPGSMCACASSPFYLTQKWIVWSLALSKHKKAGLPLLLSLERAQFGNYKMAPTPGFLLFVLWWTCC